MGIVLTLLHQKLGRFPVGIWLAFLALGDLCLAWAMQGYSLLDWNGALELGLQNESFEGGPAERAWALESWGVAMADMLWAMPVTVLGLVGLLRGRFYGLAFSLLSFSVGVYFPIVFAFQRWTTFRGTAIVALIVFTVPSLLGITGLCANRREFSG